MFFGILSINNISQLIVNKKKFHLIWLCKQTVTSETGQLDVDNDKSCISSNVMYTVLLTRMRLQVM